jgi:tyrosine-protein phosphatase YwqE
MIDLHSHILPGLDDGVRTIEEARALARRTAEDGITAIAATPHDELARYLTMDAPGAIVAGEDLPPRTSRKRRRRFVFF